MCHEAGAAALCLRGFGAVEFALADLEAEGVNVDVLEALLLA